MSADVINLADRREPPNPGNGAREAMIDLARAFYPYFGLDDLEGYSDHVLAEFWQRGFKIVPVDKVDEAGPAA